MSRRLGGARLTGLLAVVLLLVGALVVGARAGDGQRPAAGAGLQAPELVAARAAAALPGCPAGLTPDLPELALPCYAGGPDVAAAAAPGRPTVVNLWATWCPPCVAEVPALVEYAAAARGRVDVVGVVVQDSPASVYAFAEQFGVNYPLVDDALGQVRAHYGTGVPQTLLVTADGRVAHVQRAAYPSRAALEESVATHLGVRL